MEDNNIKKQEDRIQQEMVVWYNNTFCRMDNERRSLIFHVPNQNQHHLISIGVLSGVSDLIVIHRPALSVPSVTLYVEVKTPTGSQQPKQVQFQHRVTMLGYDYIVVRSLNEFKGYIIALHNELRAQHGIGSEVIL